MKIHEVMGVSGTSSIRVGDRLENLEALVPHKKAVIITDANVRRLYGEKFPKWDVIEIGTGEEAKTLDTVQDIYKGLLDLSADRSTFVVAIGGGLVCDTAGFAASTFMRGLGFGFVSTTLLSQVDASVGGKNGVNFGGFKNMVGVFNQPEFVICDLEMLKTIEQVEVLSGLAEIVKHAAIADERMFSFLEDSTEKALGLDYDTIERLVYESVVIKAGVVGRDEMEKGERRKLNFGHTLGHAFEVIAKVPHGIAVGAGMVSAARLSVMRGAMTEADEERLIKLLTALNLPVKLDVDRARMMEVFKRDKKREGDAIKFVLLGGIGEAFVEEIPIRELEEMIDKLC